MPLISSVVRPGSASWWTIGSQAGGPLSVVAALTPASIQNLTLLSGTDIWVRAGLTVTQALSLIAGDNLLHTDGTITAASLAGQVDNAGEERVRLRSDRRTPVPHAVVIGLRANSGLRMLSGFLTLFIVPAVYAVFSREHKPSEATPPTPEEASA